MNRLRRLDRRSIAKSHAEPSDVHLHGIAHPVGQFDEVSAHLGRGDLLVGVPERCLFKGQAELMILNRVRPLAES
jgi:hypothetical protein